MIYLESFRHFVQEWIKIEYPQDGRAWPWRRDKRLYLLNLYSYSSSDVFTPDTHPTPFLSILINDIDYQRPIYDEKRCLYHDYFDQDEYMLPRRYAYDPTREGKGNITSRRHNYSSNGYRMDDSTGADTRMVNVLGHRKHVRHSAYGSACYDLIRARLDELAAYAGVKIFMAENLLDITVDACTDGERPSPDMMLIQAPIIGLVYPIKKSHTYKIINGAFVLCKDPVRLAIPDEPSYNAYKRVENPFASLSKEPFMTIRGNVDTAKAVVYMAVEAPCGFFAFQEYIPGTTMNNVMEDEYARMLTHSFMVAPRKSTMESGRFAGMEIYLKHDIQEGLIQVTNAHSRYLTAQDEKLFKRSDLPDGVFKSPGGQVASTNIPVGE